MTCDIVTVTVFEAAGLTVSESKTETAADTYENEHRRGADIPGSAMVAIEAAGQGYIDRRLNDYT